MSPQKGFYQDLIYNQFFFFFFQISLSNFLKDNSVTNVFHYLQYLKSWKEKRWDDEVDSYINLHSQELN